MKTRQISLPEFSFFGVDVLVVLLEAVVVIVDHSVVLEFQVILSVFFFGGKLTISSLPRRKDKEAVFVLMIVNFELLEFLAIVESEMVHSEIAVVSVN